MHFATNLWDTCAPEAVLRAKGGEVSDVFGAPLTYRLDKPSLVNEFNAFATAPGFAAAWGAARLAVARSRSQRVGRAPAAGLCQPARIRIVIT